MTPEACRRWRELFGAYLLDRLPGGERVALEAHLDGCAECRSELDELRPVAGALPAADPSRLGAAPRPPSELADRVLERIGGARRAARRRRAGVRALAGLAAAAIAVSTFLALRPSGHREGEEFAFPVLPRGVQAVATLYKRQPGVEVWLQVEGLTPGATYAVWVERVSGERVRCGTFDAIAGNAHVVLPSTVRRADAAAVGVSAADGALVMRAPVSPPARAA